MLYKNFFLLTFFLTQDLWAYNCEAWVRNKKQKLVLQNVELSDLVSDSTFEGKYFAIHKDKSKIPVSFNDSLLSIRACTVYYHATKAREYFFKNFPDNHVRSLKSLKLRIEMPYSFIDSSHFMHEDYKSYNNSLTIPPSNNNKVEKVPEWNYEIWFAPRKKIKLNNSVHEAAKILGSDKAQENLRLSVFTSSASSLATQLAQGMTLTSQQGVLHLQSLFLSLAIVSVTPWTIEQISKIFKRTIYLDTALIPEVIYHEFAHIALSRYLKLSHHSPITEGFANYFATSVNNSPALLHKTRKFSQGLSSLKVNKKIKFSPYMEDQKNAQHGFVLSLLGEVRSILGTELADKVIYNAHTKLDANSNIRSDLLNALENSVRELTSKDEAKIFLVQLTRLWQSRYL